MDRLKALEKDRARRYGTPSELAADIQRFLNNEPVTARPPSAAYVARKYAQRHKALLAGTAAVFVVLVAGIIASTWQARRASSEAATAKAISDFLENDLLAQADAAEQAGPNRTPDPNLKVRTVLDRAAVKIGKFDNQPKVEASIRATIGRAYKGLGIYPEARKQLERALELRRRVLGPHDPQTLRTAHDLGKVADFQGRSTEAEKILSQTLEIQRRVLGPEHPDTLLSMNSLGNCYTKETKYAEAETLLAGLLEIQRRVMGPEHRDTLYTMSSLSDVFTEEGKYPQAERLIGEALEIQRRVLGPEHPDTLASQTSRADIYDAEGKRGEAEKLYNQTLEVERRVLGSEHLFTLSSTLRLANVYVERHKFVEARNLITQTVEIDRRVLGPDIQLR